MRLFIFSLLLLFLASCGSMYYANKGDYHYDALEYNKAVDYYKKSLQKGGDKEVSVKLAKSYLKMGEYEDAAFIVDSLDTKDSLSRDIHILLSRILMAHRAWDEAKKYLEKVNENDAENQLVSNWLSSIDNIDQLTKPWPSKIQAFDMDTLEAFSPFVYQDTMYFSAIGAMGQKNDPWTGETYATLFKTPMESDTSRGPIMQFADTFPDKYHLGTINLFDNGSKAFFSANQPVTENLFFKEAKSEVVSLGLYYAEKNNNEWDSLSMMHFVDKSASYVHPAHNEENNILFFSSNKSGGEGGFDIYYTTRVEGGEWSKPRSAGSKINTPGDELFPFISDENVLYFASEGHDNIGGLDIHRSQMTDNGDFREVEHLPPPVNSSKDDFGVYMLDDNEGYLSSSRSGKDRIYYFLLKKIQMIYADVTVLDTDGMPVPLSRVQVNDTMTAYTDSSGFVRIPVQKDSRYRFIASKEDFEKSSNVLEVPEEIEKDTAIFDVKIVLDTAGFTEDMLADLKKIYFDFDKYYIRKDAYIELQKLVKYLKNHPEVTIELSSHADSRGTDPYNMELSKNRALSTVTYLVENGIDVKRIKAYYFGEEFLVNDCNTPEECEEYGHQLNRRTEFKLNNTFNDQLIEKYGARKIKLKQIDLSKFEKKATADKYHDRTTVWYAVVGTFRNKDNAQKRKKELEDSGFGDVMIVNIPGDEFHRVAIEKYKYFEKAKEAYKKLKRKYPGMDIIMIKQ